MPDLANQKVAIEELRRETVTQRRELRDDWHALSESRNAVVSTIDIALAAAKAAPMAIAVFKIAFGKPQSRRLHLRTLLRRML